MAFRSADRDECTACPREQPWACHPGPGTRRYGFTLVELLVASAIMAVMIIGIGVVFRASTNASGIAEADTRALENLRVLDQALREDLENHFATSHGLLIIHSELTPTTESSLGGVDRPARVDRIAMTARGEYDSAMWAASGAGPATSDAALLSYGHGHAGQLPLNQPTASITPTLNVDAPPQGPRTEWVLCRRAILFGLPTTALDYAMPSAPKPPNNADNWFQSRTDALEATLPGFVQQFLSPLAVPPGPPAFVPGQSNPANGHGVFYARSHVPATVGPSTHRRSFPVLLPNIGDFTIEWTDGSVVDPRDWRLADGKLGPDGNDDGIPDLGDGMPDDTRVQWFGLPRDANGDGRIVAFDGKTPTNRPTGDTMPKVDWLFGPDHVPNTIDDFGTLDELRAFASDLDGPRIEQFPFDSQRPYRPTGASSDYYHASWFSTVKHWRFRPTAFRIIFRLYDPGLRISASLQERVPGAEPYTNQPQPGGSDRFGRQFTLIVP